MVVDKHPTSQMAGGNYEKDVIKMTPQKKKRIYKREVYVLVKWRCPNCGWSDGEEFEKKGE